MQKDAALTILTGKPHQNLDTGSPLQVGMFTLAWLSRTPSTATPREADC